MTDKQNNKLEKRMNALTLSTDLDEMVAAGSAAYIAASSGGIAETISMAIAVAEIEAALSPEIMKPIMSLQGKAIGFKTDKTYAVDAVKQAMVEALMIGVPMAGNCMNIIAGRCYVTKEGFTYRIKQLEGAGTVNNFRFELYPPEQKEGRVVVRGVGKWDQGGAEQRVERVFPIKTNGGSTDDNTLGKAERKLRKACYEQMSGIMLADGDVDSEGMKKAKGVQEVERDEALESAKPEAYAKLIEYDHDSLIEAFLVHGYQSGITDKATWLDQVVGEIKSIEKLNNIVKNAEKLDSSSTPISDTTPPPFDRKKTTKSLKVIQEHREDEFRGVCSELDVPVGMWEEAPDAIMSELFAKLNG